MIHIKKRIKGFVPSKYFYFVVCEGILKYLKECFLLNVSLLSCFSEETGMPSMAKNSWPHSPLGFAYR